MMKFDAVVFDLDNTLYSYDKAHAAAFEAVHELAARDLSLSRARFDELHDQASRILTKRCGGGPAIHNRLIRYQLMLEAAGLPFAAAPLLSARYWEVFLQTLEPEPGMPDALRSLKEMGLRVGVGTNMTADLQFEKLRRLGVLPLLDFLVTSEELGVEKPDPRLFALCAEKAGTEPARCVFVGDSLEKDAIAAQTAGMCGVWYCPDPKKKAPDGIPVLRALIDIPALLRSSEGRIPE